MSNKKFVPFLKEGETFLREVNPMERHKHHFDGELTELWKNAEKLCLSTARPLLQPFPVKEVYDESELSQVYQMQDTETGIWGTLRYITELVGDLDSSVREAWRYIGEKDNPLIATGISRIDYENGEQAEHTRIIGVIEAEIKEIGEQSDMYSIAQKGICKRLLTKITNGKSE